MLIANVGGKWTAGPSRVMWPFLSSILLGLPGSLGLSLGAWFGGIEHATAQTCGIKRDLQVELTRFLPKGPERQAHCAEAGALRERILLKGVSLRKKFEATISSQHRPVGLSISWPGPTLGTIIMKGTWAISLSWIHVLWACQTC